MSISHLTQDTQAALSKLQHFAHTQAGLDFEVTNTRRRCHEQNTLFAQGRDMPGTIVTGAKGCRSWHVLGRAFDILLEPNTGWGPYQMLGEYWEELGGVWGGRFSNVDDPGHFEWHPGTEIEQVCPDPDACEAGIQRSHTVAMVFPDEGTTRLGKLGTALATSGVLFAGYMLWETRRKRR